jgi:hypothetical protein
MVTSSPVVSLPTPFGKICVLDTKEGAICKRTVDVDDVCVTLRSNNHKYHDFRIEIQNINQVAAVVDMVASFD